MQYYEFNLIEGFVFLNCTHFGSARGFEKVI